MSSTRRQIPKFPRTFYAATLEEVARDTLRRALRVRDIRIAAPDKFASPANWTWTSEIARLTSEVDLVIGVLTRERRSDWTLFELGQAWANNRQILLLAPPKGGTPLPFDLKGMLIVRTTLANREAIEFALDQLLAAPQRHLQNALRFDPPRSLGPRADALLREASDAVQRQQGSELERVVERALKESGVEALSAGPMSQRGADLAVWSDALQPALGNPLLVEVKTWPGRREEFRRSASQFSKQLASSGARWGLLLYAGEPTSMALEQSMPPNVLVISLNELFERMRNESFAGVVIELRNRRVHGVAD